MLEAVPGAIGINPPPVVKSHGIGTSCAYTGVGLDACRAKRSPPAKRAAPRMGPITLIFLFVFSDFIDRPRSPQIRTPKRQEMPAVADAITTSATPVIATCKAFTTAVPVDEIVCSLIMT